jgi:hypothetical protein
MRKFFAWVFLMIGVFFLLIAGLFDGEFSGKIFANAWNSVEKRGVNE